jgi:hypothetical protein
VGERDTSTNQYITLQVKVYVGKTEQDKGLESVRGEGV